VPQLRRYKTPTGEHHAACHLIDHPLADD